MGFLSVKISTTALVCVGGGIPLLYVLFLSHCSDADECALGAHNCDQICTDDDAGWYNCSCIEGYTLNHNRHSCDGE